MTPLLELEDVHVYIGQHHILQGVSLRVRPDGVTVLLGRNGAGKTTTLRTVMSLLHPRRGSVRFDGRPTHGLPPYAVARLGIGYVPEGQGIFQALTVDENLRVARLADDGDSRSASTESSRCSRTSSASATPERARSPAGRSRCCPSPGPS